MDAGGSSTTSYREIYANSWLAKRKKLISKPPSPRSKTWLKKWKAESFPLEESLKQFENGISLARACQQALREAEQKVLQLTKDGNGEETLTAFAPPKAD